MLFLLFTAVPRSAAFMNRDKRERGLAFRKKREASRTIHHTWGGGENTEHRHGTQEGEHRRENTGGKTGERTGGGTGEYIGLLVLERG